MTLWNLPAPNSTQSLVLRAIGEAMLWPSSSSRWREVFRWIDQNPDHEISKTIKESFAAAGGDVEAALGLGRDWEMVKEPRWLTRAFAVADGGDVEVNLLMRDERRRQAAAARARRRKESFLGEAP